MRCSRVVWSQQSVRWWHRPSHPPFLCSASLEEEVVWDHDPGWNQSQCETVFLEKKQNVYLKLNKQISPSLLTTNLFNHFYSFTCSFIASFISSLNCFFTHLFIHLIIHLFIHFFIHIFIQLFNHFFIGLLISSFASLHLFFIHLFIHIFIYFFIHLFVNLFIYFFIHLFIHFFSCSFKNLIKSPLLITWFRYEQIVKMSISNPQQVGYHAIAG